MDSNDGIGWLPDLIKKIPDWEEYRNVLHAAYLNEYKNKSRPLTFHGKPVVVRVQPRSFGFEESFWHLVGGAGQIPDYDRCSKILWAAAIIRNCCDEHVMVKEQYGYRGGNKKSFVLWLRCRDYMVVLEEREKYFLLVTAYPVNKTGKRKDLERLFGVNLKKTDTAD